MVAATTRELEGRLGVRINQMLPGVPASVAKQIKAMLAPVVIGAVFAVPVAFYQAAQFKKERSEQAERDKIELAKAEQIKELRRCNAALDSVDSHCAKYTMGAHCQDAQCVKAIKAVVNMGGRCSQLVNGFTKAQQSGVVALMQCNKGG